MPGADASFTQNARADAGNTQEGERRFHSVDPGFTWTDIHTSQLPFLHSWVVWVAGPLLGARFFGFQIVATELKGFQCFVESFS